MKDQNKKFKAFLEALRTDDNANLIETVLEGHNTFYECGDEMAVEDAVSEPITGTEVPVEESEGELMKMIRSAQNIESLRKIAAGLAKKLEQGESELY